MSKAKPIRLQRTRRRGTRLESPNGLPVVCVTRPGRWGNPFRVGMPNDTGTIEPGEAVEMFRRWIGTTTAGAKFYEDARAELRGKNLACWCSLDAPCHADVLLEVANAPARPGPKAKEQRP